MGRGRVWSGGSRRLAILLLAVVLPPAATLVWLGTQLLQQDRAALEQRELERRTAIGQAVAAHLRQSLRAAEGVLESSAIPEGFVRFVLSDEGLDVTPAARLLWTPVPRRLRPAAEEPFDSATVLEYRGDLEGALTAYRRLARSPDRAIQAGAVRRVARVHRRAQRWDAALVSYRALAEFADISDLDIPADLLARRNAADVLHAAGRTEELAREAAALERDLLASTWSIDRAAWEVAVADLDRWRGIPVDVPQERRSISTLAEQLWREFRAGATAGEPSPRVLDIEGTAVTVISRSSNRVRVAVAVLPAVLQSWTADAVAGAFADDARLAIVSPSSRLLAGTEAPAGAPVVRLSASDTGLPWALTLSADSWSRAGEQFEYRRRLLAAGLVAILLLLGGGSYFLWRVVQRELAVSRLHAEFVAAVSHEFRTPLTSLQHVTELLEEDDTMPAERRQAFYQVYRRNTRRLHQLVESLLDFARMEAGRKGYRLQPVDVARFVAEVIDEYRIHAPAVASRITVAGSCDAVDVEADRAALSNALWNLLDNAVKYSRDEQPIQVTVSAHSAGVAIEVRDCGLGIPEGERDAVFERFVRGRQAVQLGIKGTGLGLAMVAHIMRAHRGTVEVVSQHGVGSTFRLVLPVMSRVAEAGPHYEPA